MRLSAFVSALGSHEMGRHKVLIIIKVVFTFTTRIMMTLEGKTGAGDKVKCDKMKVSNRSQVLNGKVIGTRTETRLYLLTRQCLSRNASPTHKHTTCTFQ